MAEVINFDDFKQMSFNGKAAGKNRKPRKNYFVQDGDIILFRFNTDAGFQNANVHARCEVEREKLKSRYDNQVERRNCVEKQYSKKQKNT